MFYNFIAYFFLFLGNIPLFVCHLIFTKAHKQLNGESIVVSANSAGCIQTHLQNMSLNLILTPYIKNQLKMNYKSNFKVIKLLEENLPDPRLSKVFFTEAGSIKEVEKLEFIKIKYLCPAKSII